MTTLADGLAAPPAWMCPTCGRNMETMCAAVGADCSPSARMVVARLEEAGRTLLALRGRTGPAGYRSAMPDSVRDLVEAYGAGRGRILPAIPSAAAISRMDAALTWLSVMPGDRIVLRRIVGARAMIDPVTGRHLYSWRRLGLAVGADHKAVQRWHADGIARIVVALRARRGVAA